RVDHAGSVSDDRGTDPGEPGAGQPQRQAVAAHVAEIGGIEAVRLAQPRQLDPEVGRLVTPAPDADVHMVALGEDPAVAPGHRAELDHEPAAIALRIDRAVRCVALDGDADRTVAAEVERL